MRRHRLADVVRLILSHGESALQDPSRVGRNDAQGVVELGVAVDRRGAGAGVAERRSIPQPRAGAPVVLARPAAHGRDLSRREGMGDRFLEAAHRRRVLRARREPALVLLGVVQLVAELHKFHRDSRLRKRVQALDRVRRWELHDINVEDGWWCGVGARGSRRPGERRPLQRGGVGVVRVIMTAVRRGVAAALAPQPPVPASGARGVGCGVGPSWGKGQGLRGAHQKLEGVPPG